MAYRVKTENFEGPFDLLLDLVSRQKVDIGSISIGSIVDQYLAEISAMDWVDLEVASDFLLVASTLLEIKAAALLPERGPDAAAEGASPSDPARSLLERLLTYRQFKAASAMLAAREDAQGRRHGRTCGPGEEFAAATPDFLADVDLDRLARMAAEVLGRRELELLEAEHIAAKPLPVERYVASLRRLLAVRKRASFQGLFDEDATPALFVVTFLAMLELFKRQEITLTQSEPFGDILITAKGLAETPAVADDRS